MMIESLELDPQELYSQIKNLIGKDLPDALDVMDYVSDLLEHAENDGNFDIIFDLRRALSALEDAEDALTEAMDGLWAKEEEFTRGTQ